MAEEHKLRPICAALQRFVGIAVGPGPSPADPNIENNINGEVLMEMDQTQLKEMGIKKIGDRVRIGSQAKLFRNKEYRKSKRNSNRVSLAAPWTSHAVCG